MMMPPSSNVPALTPRAGRRSGFIGLLAKRAARDVSAGSTAPAGRDAASLERRGGTRGVQSAKSAHNLGEVSRREHPGRVDFAAAVTRGSTRVTSSAWRDRSCSYGIRRVFYEGRLGVQVAGARDSEDTYNRSPQSCAGPIAANASPTEGLAGGAAGRRSGRLRSKSSALFTRGRSAPCSHRW